MGEVWAAEDTRGREVAIKVLLQRAAMKPDLVRRFEREAKITSSVKSPFVCQLLDVTRAEDGTTLLVFEHLTGESLSDRLKREQYLPLSEVGPIIDDVLQGLGAAHAVGVIHRDLKPGNIFVERTSSPDRPERGKILDFGISKITGHKKEEPTLTAFDATLGSFAYMAPEQIRGAARADERADIYAVGAVAFRALAGRLPFEGTSAAVLVSLKLDRNAPTLEEATGEKWPSGVERFLEKALAKAREGRFATAAEALQAWRAAQPGNITRARLPPSSHSGVPAARPSSKGSAEPPRSAPKKHAPAPPFPALPSLSFTGSHAAFPEDMPTEVDDSPPTMTGDEAYDPRARSKQEAGRDAARDPSGSSRPPQSPAARGRGGRVSQRKQGGR
jgi:eukaryotic-like serine/threonine-protein kinase